MRPGEYRSSEKGGKGEQRITSPAAVLLTVSAAQFMVPLMLSAAGVALPSTITLVLSLSMGGQTITQATMPLFVSSMQAALIAFAVFSGSGLATSMARKRNK